MKSEWKVIAKYHADHHISYKVFRNIECYLFGEEIREYRDGELTLDEARNLAIKLNIEEATE